MQAAPSLHAGGTNARTRSAAHRAPTAQHARFTVARSGTQGQRGSGRSTGTASTHTVAPTSPGASVELDNGRQLNLGSRLNLNVPPAVILAAAAIAVQPSATSPHKGKLVRLQLEVRVLATQHAALQHEVDTLRAVAASHAATQTQDSSAARNVWSAVVRATRQLHAVRKQLFLRILLMRNIHRSPRQGVHCLSDPVLEYEAEKLLAESKTADGAQLSAVAMAVATPGAAATTTLEAELQLAQLDVEAQAATRDALIMQSLDIRAHPACHFALLDHPLGRCHELLRNFRRLQDVLSELEVSQERLFALQARWQQERKEMLVKQQAASH